MKVLAGVHTPDDGRMTFTGQTYSPSGTGGGTHDWRRHDPPRAEPRAPPLGRRQHRAGAGTTWVSAASTNENKTPRLGARWRGSHNPTCRSLRRLVRCRLPCSSWSKSPAQSLRDARVVVFDEPTSVLGEEDTETSVLGHPRPARRRYRCRLHQPLPRRGADTRRRLYRFCVDGRSGRHGTASRHFARRDCPRDGRSRNRRTISPTCLTKSASRC